MPLAFVNADGLAAQGCSCRVFARQIPAMPRGCTLRASATWRGSRQALWLHGRAPVLRRAATRLHAVNKVSFCSDLLFKANQQRVQVLSAPASAPATSHAQSALKKSLSVLQIDKLNTEELEVAIQERNKPLIVDFFATWCGPCVLLAKELEQARSPFLVVSFPVVVMCLCVSSASIISQSLLL